MTNVEACRVAPRLRQYLASGVEFCWLQQGHHWAAWQLGSSHDTANAAGGDPEAASAAANGPWHARCIFMRGAAATNGTEDAARRSNPCDIFWSRATAGRDKKRARHTLRLTTRLLLRSSPVPQVNGPCKAFAPAAAGRNPPTFAPFAGRKVKIPNFWSALLD
jgi:hypothetical protein